MRTYKNTCMVGTSYALSVYLLKMELPEIMNTFFICGSNVHSSLVERLPHAYQIKNSSRLDGDILGLLKLFLKKYICWPFMFSTNLYAQDHAIYFSEIIGGQKYTFIPDGPGVFHMIDKINGLKPYAYGENKKGLLRKLKYFLLKRPTSGKYWGTNDYCVDRWITSADDISSPYMSGRKYTLLDYAEMWRNSDEVKKEFIKNVYAVDSAIMDMLVSADVMVFTQPFMTDCEISAEDQYSIYNNAIRDYEGKKILIKPHPRDKFDYDKFFPQCKVLHSFAPQQLLNAIGCSPEVVITVCSTAISEMPESTKKIYLGTKVHPAVYEVYGDQCNK